MGSQAGEYATYIRTLFQVPDEVGEDYISAYDDWLCGQLLRSGDSDGLNVDRTSS